MFKIVSQSVTWITTCTSGARRIRDLDKLIASYKRYNCLEIVRLSDVILPFLTWILPGQYWSPRPSPPKQPAVATPPTVPAGHHMT